VRARPRRAAAARADQSGDVERERELGLAHARLAALAVGEVARLEPRRDARPDRARLRVARRDLLLRRAHRGRDAVGDRAPERDRIARARHRLERLGAHAPLCFEVVREVGDGRLGRRVQRRLGGGAAAGEADAEDRDRNERNGTEALGTEHRRPSSAGDGRAPAFATPRRDAEATAAKPRS
jgi:hypothetical protein